MPTITEVQEALTRTGNYEGRIDDVFGPKTQAAYEEYWKSRSVEVTVPIIPPPAAKPWWRSVTQWSLLALFALVAYQALASGQSAEDINAMLVSIIELVGVLTALAGNTTRSQPIDPDLILPGLRK